MNAPHCCVIRTQRVLSWFSSVSPSKHQVSVFKQSTNIPFQIPKNSHIPASSTTPTKHPVRRLTSNSQTNSTQRNPSWQTNSSSTNHEIPRILRNPKVHYRIHKSRPLVPILLRSITSTPLPPDFFKIHFNITLPSTPRSSKRFLAVRFPHRNSTCTSPSPTCAT